jgi:hypothetical protein
MMRLPCFEVIVIALEVLALILFIKVKCEDLLTSSINCTARSITNSLFLELSISNRVTGMLYR